MIASTGGDSGKTLMTLGLISTWHRKGIPVVPFKKGPDYIDPAWLRLAAGKDARNLDTWMMGVDLTLRSFTSYAVDHGVNLIEANRGLHDGEDARGTHSSAELTKLLKCPVVLVIPTVKVTRTVAAMVLGIKMFDPDVQLVGVILNQIATARQEAVIRRAVEDEAGLSVLGVLPRLKNDPLPGRHLGLVTPEEHILAEKALDVAAELVADNVDTDKLYRISQTVLPLQVKLHVARDSTRHGKGTFGVHASACEPSNISGQHAEACTPNSISQENVLQSVKIGYFTGSAFTFYYPENLKAIESNGVILIPIDPFERKCLPEIDALYIGGGFPETHAASLSDNETFRKSVAAAAENGLPVYAECGGLMFLSRSIKWQNKIYMMSGIFKNDVTISKRPQGHGYMEVLVDCANPFFETGVKLRGHEFHYSQIDSIADIPTVFAVNRGSGLGHGRDGMIYRNVLACYLHLHSVGTPEWVEGIVKAAIEYRRSRSDNTEL